MERFNNKNLNAYDYLAYYYDMLLGDEEAFNLWLNEIEKEEFSSVLELASGSGVLAQILTKKGYQVIASDISTSMKEAAKKNYDGEYLILNMADYHLNKKFDLLLCVCDSFNYLVLDEIKNFFKCAYEHLNKNGRIIFDMHHINRLVEFEEEYIEEGEIEGLQYQWTINSDKTSNLINEHFTFYTSDGMIQEQHTQHVYQVNDVLKIMKEIGFGVECNNDFVKNEKVLIVGRK